MKPLIRDLTYKELETSLKNMGAEKFRAKQIYNWLSKGVQAWDDMRNIPNALKVKLDEAFDLSAGVLVETLQDPKDDTRKHLIRMRDGQAIETVSMIYQHGHSVCVSTQVGCKMGCWFCASTIDGLVRNLTAGEMLSQVILSAKNREKPVTHVVLMGSGEPLDNFQEVIKFLEFLKDPEGLMISHRHVTLSTCGLVPQIMELAELKLQITLAISLHAANDELRTRLVPVNKRYPIASLIKACKYYFDMTGRRITFEYALLKGVNDTKEDAKQLVELIRGMNCHVNLIPANTVEEKTFSASENLTIDRFQKVLKDAGISVTTRRELGDAIQAACGQLRQQYIKEKNNL